VAKVSKRPGKRNQVPSSTSLLGCLNRKRGLKGVFVKRGENEGRLGGVEKRKNYVEVWR
jgi:hypothetical protein